jgi:hypothetical protein
LRPVGADDALVDAAIALWVVAIGLGYGLNTPTLRNQIRALAAECSSRGRSGGVLRGQVLPAPGPRPGSGSPVDGEHGWAGLIRARSASDELALTPPKNIPEPKLQRRK